MGKRPRHLTGPTAGNNESDTCSDWGSHLCQAPKIETNARPRQQSSPRDISISNSLHFIYCNNVFECPCIWSECLIGGGININRYTAISCFVEVFSKSWKYQAKDIWKKYSMGDSQFKIEDSRSVQRETKFLRNVGRSRVSASCGQSISRGASLFSYLLGEMTHIIQTTDEGQLQCLTIEFALPAARWVWWYFPITTMYV
jgi:hypothetical protein